ncbi:pitrilysin family protein [Halobacteriovorax sp. GB3]|uniref:M16 family metallopeptidase n=1 Tax=Halobacteriovorax sp. GB3 TaxID=2719615 RepID=UPI00235F4309|nr:pitrilysin family protein [Halobacteriovorax sp. GB3]MDD0854466.1 pitrilysin family protein [Halobacteriovorax sp. GB3]
MNFEKTRLANGLETIFINSPGSTSATVQIWFRAGSALEEKSNEGIAHFLEHMFFKGTQTRPGAAIAHEVESFGGEINAFTSFDFTCYYINTPSSHLMQTTDILMDMVSNPMFLHDDIVPERGVVFEEYRRSQDNPNQFAFQKIQKSCFTGGYAHAILGREDTIKNFSQEQLKDFRTKFYNTNNAFLVIAGDLSQKEEIIKKVESFTMPEGEFSNFPNFTLKKKAALDVHQKDVRMMTMTLSTQAPEYDHRDAAAEDLAYNTLGHGETSRLYKNLILKGTLANSCASSTMFMAKGGIHLLRVSFPEENFSKVLSQLTKVFKELSDKGFSKEEIQKIKNQYVASKLYDKESLDSFTFSMSSTYAQTGDLNSEEDFLAQIKKTSVNGVNEAIKNILSRPFHISMQTPKHLKQADVKKTLAKFQKDLETISPRKLKEKSKLKIDKSKYDEQVKVVTLKEGIKLLYRYNPMTPTFVFHGYLKGGLTEESKKNNGIHHLLSGTIAKAYKGKTYPKLKQILEDNSASLSGFSGKNAYGMTMHGQTEHIEELLTHFLGCFITPSFPNNLINQEKKITLRGIESQKEDPIRHCFRAFSTNIFNGHPYSFNMNGTEDTVKKIKREDIIKLHNNNIKKKEILFTYCGDLSLEEVINLVTPRIKDLKKRTTKKLQKKSYKSISKHVYIPFDREQTQIFYGVPSGDLNSKENTIFKMLTSHLSGQSSELFVEVRDRQGLCYTAQPLHFNALEGGYWGIYMASGHDKITPAFKAIQDIIAKIRDNGLSEEEFNRIKVMIEGQNLINVQTNEDYANVYAVPTLQGMGVDYYHKSNKAINDLSYEDFQKQIKKVLSRKWTSVVVGRSDK